MRAPCGQVDVTAAGGGSCSADADCPDGQVCENGQCVASDSSGGGGVSLALIGAGVVVGGIYVVTRN